MAALGIQPCWEAALQVAESLSGLAGVDEDLGAIIVQDFATGRPDRLRRVHGQAFVLSMLAEVAIDPILGAIVLAGSERSPLGHQKTEHLERGRSILEALGCKTYPSDTDALI
jgi:hypothetical protein